MAQDRQIVPCIPVQYIDWTIGNVYEGIAVVTKGSFNMGAFA